MLVVSEFCFIIIIIINVFVRCCFLGVIFCNVGFEWVASNVRLPFGKTWRVIVYVRVEVRNTTWYYMVDSLDKVDVPNLVTFFYWTSIFEWYVIKVGFKNGY
jgi:hypothetical protein